MRKIIMGISLVAVLLIPMELAYARGNLGGPYLGENYNPNGNNGNGNQGVTQAQVDAALLKLANGTGTAEEIAAAKATIAGASVEMLKTSITSLATSNPELKSKVAANAAAFNAALTVADAAGAAGVSTGAVYVAAANMVTKTIATEGTGGAPSAAELDKAFKDNPNLITDLLSGLSTAEVTTLTTLLKSGGSFEKAASLNL